MPTSRSYWKVLLCQHFIIMFAVFQFKAPLSSRIIINSIYVFFVTIICRWKFGETFHKNFNSFCKTPLLLVPVDHQKF